MFRSTDLTNFQLNASLASAARSSSATTNSNMNILPPRNTTNSFANILPPRNRITPYSLVRPNSSSASIFADDNRLPRNHDGSFQNYVVSFGGDNPLGVRNFSSSAKRQKALAIASDMNTLRTAVNSFDTLSDNQLKVNAPLQNAVDNYVQFVSTAGHSPWPVTYESLTIFISISIAAGYSTSDDKIRMIRKFAALQNQLVDFSPVEKHKWDLNLRRARATGVFDHSQALPCNLTMIQEMSIPSSLLRCKSLLCFYFGLRPDELQYVSSSTLSISQCKKFFCLDFTKLPPGALKRRVTNTCTVQCVHDKQFGLNQTILHKDMCICHAVAGIKKQKMLGKMSFDDDFKSLICDWTGELNPGSKKGYGFRVGCIHNLIYGEQSIGLTTICRHLRWSSAQMSYYYMRFYKFPDDNFRDIIFCK